MMETIIRDILAERFKHFLKDFVEISEAEMELEYNAHKENGFIWRLAREITDEFEESCHCKIEGHFW